MFAFPFYCRSRCSRAAVVAIAALLAAVSAAQTHGHASATVDAYLKVAPFASLSVSSSPSSATVQSDLSLNLKNDGNGAMIRDADVQPSAPTFTVYCWANNDAVLSADVAGEKAVLSTDEAIAVPVVYGWPTAHSATIPARSSHLAQVLSLDVAANATYPRGSGSAATDADGTYNAFVTVTIVTE